MRRSFTYLFPFCFVALLFTSCLKGESAADVAASFPVGTFTGQFRAIHKSTTGIDTQKANITLTLSTQTGFKITGDTATLHAGSHGGYLFNTTYGFFSDSTYSATSTSTKVHLNGTYLYSYNGTVFQMLQVSGDTLSYQYDLTKQ